jgi:hypothetical protein
MTSVKEKLEKIIYDAKDSGKVVDVSEFKASGFNRIPKPKTTKSTKKSVTGIAVVSDNYKSFDLAMSILGDSYLKYSKKFLDEHGEKSYKSPKKSTSESPSKKRASPTSKRRSASPKKRSASKSPLKKRSASKSPLKKRPASKSPLKKSRASQKKRSASKSPSSKRRSPSKKRSASKSPLKKRSASKSPLKKRSAKSAQKSSPASPKKTKPASPTKTKPASPKKTKPVSPKKTKNAVGSNPDLFYCVKPYNPAYATTKDRINSCEKGGKPSPRFKTGYAQRQNCVNECYYK